MKMMGRLQLFRVAVRKFIQKVYLFAAAMEVDEFDLLERRVRVLETRIASLHSKKE